MAKLLAIAVMAAHLAGLRRVARPLALVLLGLTMAGCHPTICLMCNNYSQPEAPK